MSIRDIGKLLPADEGLNHQIVNTFATISESDHAWTEKLWVSIASTDGSVQVDFGLGKYHNRGIVDGFGGVSQGRKQWTVRGSRELDSAPEETSIGPLSYSVVEPLQAVRVVLEPNDVQPISFDLVLRGVTVPYFEERNLVRSGRTGRIDVDVIRYHQGGWATGTVTVGDETYDFGEGEAFGFRDHSWGVRQGVGMQPPDLIGTAQAIDRRVGRRGIMKWSPSFFRRPDGTYYETAVFVTGGDWDYTSAYVNEADGTQAKVRVVTPKMEYDPRTRFVRRGELHLVMETGEARVIEVRALGESGFFLKTAKYGSWNGHLHGSWIGPFHLEGEYIADCWDGDQQSLLGQFRDTPIAVQEGDAVGFGIMESIISGEWPELGLDAESDRRVAYS